MPKHIIPWRNTPHRVAAIALYRALLSQSQLLTSATNEQRHALQNIIRNRFKQSQYVQSPRLLKVSFEAGYEAVDYLDAAIGGDDDSRAYILDLLERSPARVKQPKPTPLVSNKKKVSSPAGPQDGEAIERPRTKLFDRPLPLEKLSGRRHVPVLFSANHIPVLRIKKPQPESLSRYIYQRIAQRQKWHDRRNMLMEDLNIARLEDQWDELISYNARALKDSILYGDSESETQWQHAIREAALDVDEKIKAESVKYKVMAEKMQAVVDREQALYDEEKRARTEARKLEHFAGEAEQVNFDQDQ